WRIPVKFSETFQKTVIPDLTDYNDTLNNKIKSVTGQLSWTHGENEYFTINTPGTKGIVGFLPDEKVNLDGWEIESDNKFAVIFITSLEKEKNLHETTQILVTTVARGKNTGMEYNKAGDTLISKGTAPLLLEPVNFNLKIPGKNNYQIETLDHDGKSLGQPSLIQNGIVRIKGAESKAIWYLISGK